MTELADTSAWIWTRRPAHTDLRQVFDNAVIDGRVATCDMVRLELLRSARNPAEFTRLRRNLGALDDAPIEKKQWNRAVWVYEQLCTQGGMHHRAVQHPDLLIAAAAEAAGIPVLHYDSDYDRIAEVTGQPTRWLAPQGSLH